MKKNKLLLAIVPVLILFALFSTSAFIVKETEQVVLTQFGQLFRF